MHNTTVEEKGSARGAGKIPLIIGMIAVLFVVFSGLVPGPIIVPVSCVVVLVSCLLGGHRSGFLGFSRPPSWGGAILTGLAVGLLLTSFVSFVLFPLLGRLDIALPDFSILEVMRGDPVRLALFLLLAWTSAAFGEEIVFRGFFFGVLKEAFGEGRAVTAGGLAANTVIFGLAHSYQGTSGIFLTGFAGLILALLFLNKKRNLWFPIMAHGFADTLAFIAIYAGWWRT